MNFSLSGKTVLITGASMGIGRSIALAAAKAEARALILFARSSDRLDALGREISKLPNNKTVVVCMTVDIRSYKEVNEAVEEAMQAIRGSGASTIDVLVNNAGLALGAPSTFPELKIPDIDSMLGTNLNGMMYVTHAVLNAGGMMGQKPPRGMILNITSTTGLEVPPFPGEAVYHTTKAAQEAFTNVLRTELQHTNIKVVALRPGVVATNFHQQRVGYDKESHDDFMAGFEPLVADDVAEQAVYLMQQGPERVCVKALDVVPTAQRTLQVIDKGWNQRNGREDTKM